MSWEQIWTDEQNARTATVKDIFSTKTVTEVDGPALETLIKTAYGLTENYEIVAYEELSNCEHNVDVSAGPLDEYDQEKVDEMINTKEPQMWALPAVLQDMCNKGLVPEGTLLIDVTW